MDRTFDRVFVTPPGETYVDCVSRNPEHHTIDIFSARQQHAGYVRILKEHGIKVDVLPTHENYPDSVFVQDTALVGERTGTAVLCRFGEPSRRGEEKLVEERLETDGYRLEEIKAPGTLEGGDILVTDRDTVFVGISERTNNKGVNQLAEYFPDIEFVKVPVEKVFHLLSAVNFIGKGTLAICPSMVDRDYFHGFDLLEIPEKQNSTYDNKPINMLYLGNKHVLMPDAYPGTEKILEENGYVPVTTNLSEFWKGDAGVTCPILPLYREL
ncbi:MAG: arginine deiminase family protein [Thermoplasmata archaeon]